MPEIPGFWFETALTEMITPLVLDMLSNKFGDFLREYSYPRILWIISFEVVSFVS